MAIFDVRMVDLEGRTVLITFFSKTIFIRILNKIGTILWLFDAKSMALTVHPCQKNLIFENKAELSNFY